MKLSVARDSSTWNLSLMERSMMVRACTLLLDLLVLRTLMKWDVLAIIRHRVRLFDDVVNHRTVSWNCASGNVYDLAHATLMGAQINQPNFNSTGAWQAFGPWEQSHGATFFPGVFDLRSRPSPNTPGSTVEMVSLFRAYAYVWRLLTLLSCDFPGPY
jgi:hypothetical protein